MRSFFVLFFLLIGIPSATGQTTVMTFNIRYDNPEDGDNAWNYRKTEVVELIQKYHPDFIGIQEALPRQVSYIRENLVGYGYFGYGRDGINTPSEATPIFFNSHRFELLDQRLFWLSPTPEKISIGWDAALNRIAVYCKFRNRETGDLLHVVNTHFDHQGKKARLRSAKLLLDFIKREIPADQKTILMGDLNATPKEAPVQTLEKYLDNSRESSPVITEGSTGTFNGFDTNAPAINRIDYIFVKNIEVKSYQCIEGKRKNGLYTSDHFPILITF